VIQSFADKETEELFHSESSRRYAAILRVAIRKLIQLNQARALRDLAVPPGNQLKRLRGDLADFYSVRINDQWRILFKWTAKGPAEVAIIDYH